MLGCIISIELDVVSSSFVSLQKIAHQVPEPKEGLVFAVEMHPTLPGVLNAAPSPATHAIWIQLKAGETAALISKV